MSYEIALDVFQGPLDLLLHLIEKNEVDIYNIPIALITEKYLEYLHTMELLNLEGVGDFLVMAATLMQIKAKMLLPQSIFADNEEESIDEDDPRWELAQKLIEYKKIKLAAQSLQSLEAGQLKIYTRSYGDFADLKIAPESNPLKNLSIWDLFEAFKVILESLVEPEINTLPKQEVSVKQRMTEILDRLHEQGQVNFQTVFSEVKSKIAIITCFLAVLELIRLHKISVFQDGTFGTITLSLTEKVSHTA